MGRVCRGWADSAACSLAQRFAVEAASLLESANLRLRWGRRQLTAANCGVGDATGPQHSTALASDRRHGHCLAGVRGAWRWLVQVGKLRKGSGVTFLIVERRTTAQRHTKEGRACVSSHLPRLLLS